MCHRKNSLYSNRPLGKVLHMKTFQDIITTLQAFWTSKQCILQQGYDLESGAGTFNPETFLRCLGPEPFRLCNVEICRRPTDGRYGKNPNRLQKFHQFQVILKPSPPDFQKLYLESLEEIGFNLKNHDIRFVHDDWESPTQGAWGLGWEVWCDGMEITQFTYFQSIGGLDVKPVAGELAYGLERIAMFLQNKSNVYDVAFNDELTYGDVFLQSEVESCHYNFETANTEMLQRHFQEYESEAKKQLGLGFPTIAYDFAVRASHTFNLLDARSAISTTARVNLMHRIKDLCCQSAELYVSHRKAMGFPLLKESLQKEAFKPKAPQFNRIKPSTIDDLLIEIGSEEIPSAFLPAALSNFEKAIRTLFEEKELLFESIELFGTPRRIAIILKGTAGGTLDQMIERKGPGVDIAFDENGKLTKQGLGFFSSIDLQEASRSAVEAGEIEHLQIKEGKYLFAMVKKKGTATIDIIREALPQIIANLSFPKKMRWGTGSETYARPIQWITLLYGRVPIEIKYGDIVSSNITYGHSQIDPRPIKIRHPRQYRKKLKNRWVIANIAERKNHLNKQLDKICEKLEVQIPEREKVLNEVLFLSEYPFIGSSTFESRFLDLPPELLISEMIDHQRYFPLKDQEGNLLPQFLVAVDKKPTEQILRNNSAVLTARLSDGLFLYEQDLLTPLESFNEKLKNVVFHKDLGSIFDKSVRVKKMAEKLATILGKAPPLQAAELCKADLASAVVYEFPDLQGIMGKYYALKAGRSEDVATAICEHWWPLTEGSSIPTTESGSILALADKLDNLQSYMKVGIKPSSSKDPYALRRSAIGIIRILIENRYSLDLEKVTTEEVIQYILQRIKNVLNDFGFSKEVVAAVLSCDLKNPFDIYCRAEALHTFRKSGDDFDLLFQVYKRARGQIENETEKSFDLNLLTEVDEKKLARCLEEIKPILDDGIPRKDYISAFNSLNRLSQPLSNFFENVRVLSDDKKLRDNRIALLQQVFHLTSRLVDFTKL